MSVPSSSVRRWEPYAGIAYVVFFVASLLVSNPPADNASDRTWIARYTGHSEQAGHLATAFLLLLAGLALMTFLVALWRRIAEVHPAESPSRLPIAAAGAAAALIGAGGMVMGYISGGEIVGHYPLPSADLLRMSNDLGFALAGVAGSWAAAVAVATLSVQGHAAGVFGTKMRAAGIITAVALLFSILFVPIVALLAWVLVAAISWIRQSRRHRARHRLGSPDARPACDPGPPDPLPPRKVRTHAPSHVSLRSNASSDGRHCNRLCYRHRPRHRRGRVRVAGQRSRIHHVAHSPPHRDASSRGPVRQGRIHRGGQGPQQVRSHNRYRPVGLHARELDQGRLHRRPRTQGRSA